MDPERIAVFQQREAYQELDRGSVGEAEPVKRNIWDAAGPGSPYNRAPGVAIRYVVHDTHPIIFFTIHLIAKLFDRHLVRDSVGYYGGIGAVWGIVSCRIRNE